MMYKANIVLRSLVECLIHVTYSTHIFELQLSISAFYLMFFSFDYLIIHRFYLIRKLQSQEASLQKAVVVQLHAVIKRLLVCCIHQREVLHSFLVLQFLYVSMKQQLYNFPVGRVLKGLLILRYVDYHIQIHLFGQLKKKHNRQCASIFVRNIYIYMTELKCRNYFLLEKHLVNLMRKLLRAGCYQHAQNTRYLPQVSKHTQLIQLSLYHYTTILFDSQ